MPDPDQGRAPDLRAGLASLPSDWRLVRVGANKRPIAGENWYDADNFSPDDAAELNGHGPPAWGLKSGPASGVIVLDLDAEGWRDSFHASPATRSPTCRPPSPGPQANPAAPVMPSPSSPTGGRIW